MVRAVSAHDGTDDKADTGLPVDQQAQRSGNDQTDNQKDLVLIGNEGVGTDTDRRGDLLHLFRTLIHLADLGEVKGGKCQRAQGHNDD